MELGLHCCADSIWHDKVVNIRCYCCERDASIVCSEANVPIFRKRKDTSFGPFFNSVPFVDGIIQIRKFELARFPYHSRDVVKTTKLFHQQVFYDGKQFFHVKI